MLSQHAVKEAVFDSLLDENQESLNRKLAFAPKQLRQSFLHDDKECDEARISAAIEIQRVWRGYQSRANLLNAVHPHMSKTAVYSGSKHAVVRQEDFSGYDENGRPTNAARLRLENYYTDFLAQLQEVTNKPARIPTFEDFCATYIQSWWQELWKEKKPKQTKHTSVTSIKSQPEVIVPKRPPRLLNTTEAAAIIQRAWRRHIDIQVYRYYRDLINFKTRGNPSLMLRCINPQEAKMLDAASGIHVKFRLAGERFPPNIYYKIFTHRPIQDLCANSPKNYTLASVKLKMGKDVHHRGRMEPKPDDRSEWYRRADNNGWRLVSDRLIHHIMSDPVTWETSQKKYEFSHDKLIRKQDVEKRKKKKKIQWMQKMYKDGMLKAKSDDQDTVQLIDGAAAGMIATVENYGPDALEDWEVDELLDWTTSLNFEDYQNGWKELATSANSEKQVENRTPTAVWRRMHTASDTATEEKLRLFTSTADPYEFTLSNSPSRYQSTQQSRNTPVSSVSSTSHAQAVN